MGGIKILKIKGGICHGINAFAVDVMVMIYVHANTKKLNALAEALFRNARSSLLLFLPQWNKTKTRQGYPVGEKVSW